MVNGYDKFGVLWTYAIYISPRITPKEILLIEEVAKEDVLIIKKNGEIYLATLHTTYVRPIMYDSPDLTKEEWLKEFSRRMITILRRENINQSELAERIGIKQQMISRYVRGEVMPSGYVIDKICYALDIPREDLLLVPTILYRYYNGYYDKCYNRYEEEE